MVTSSQTTMRVGPRSSMLFSILCCDVVTSMTAANWLAASSATQRQLGLLPFPIEEALLPGETKQVHLYEARFIQLFADAASKHDSCIGMLLFTNQGAVGTTSLLEVDEYRKEEFGVWARLKCVGRVQLLDLDQTDYGYVVGTVSHVAERRARRTDRAEVASVLSTLCELHESVCELERKLKGSRADDRPVDERVEWGHEERYTASDEGVALADLIASRRAVLVSRGPDALPHATLVDSCKEVWGVSDDEAAEATLQSFAACATLSATVRAKALAMTSVQERCALVIEALEGKRRRLAALAALQGATSTTGEK